mgnify:CR=1 FL=1
MRSKTYGFYWYSPACLLNESDTGEQFLEMLYKVSRCMPNGTNNYPTVKLAYTNPLQYTMRVAMQL